MNIAIQVCLVIIGGLIVGLNAGVLWILSDLRNWLKTLDQRVSNHVENATIHCSPEKMQRK